MTKTASLMAIAAAATIAITGLATSADAKGKRVFIKVGSGHHHFKHHHHHRRFFVAGPVYGYGYGGGCGYAKSMWWKTGSLYWKDRYYTCKGW